MWREVCMWKMVCMSVKKGQAVWYCWTVRTEGCCRKGWLEVVVVGVESRVLPPWWAGGWMGGSTWRVGGGLRADFGVDELMISFVDPCCQL